jgi:hypothetical protein
MMMGYGPGELVGRSSRILFPSEEAILLKQAGVAVIQPGIEALHSGLLKLMKKGARAKQNIALLRYARALNISVQWNLLYGFPGEQTAWFAEVLRHVPALEHLPAPTGIYQINIDRFSPFFSAPAAHGFNNLRPHPAYAEIFAAAPDSSQLAYHFCADAQVPTLADSPILPELQQAITRWQTQWQANLSSSAPTQRQNTPNCVILALAQEQYLLIDSRRNSQAASGLSLNYEQAAACLVEHYHPSAATDWALANGLALEMDGCIVPLAIAEPNVLLRFEADAAMANTAPVPSLNARGGVMAIKVSAA